VKRRLLVALFPAISDKEIVLYDMVSRIASRRGVW